MSGNLICPVCCQKTYKSLSKHLHKCHKCKNIFNSGYTIPSYDREYFLDDYRNQYGKTYLEDFPNIYRLSEIRINRILQLIKNDLSPGPTTLLDVGSAAGFFLKCASDKGVGTVVGIEISKYASEYSRKEFGFHIITKPFDTVEKLGSFNIITAWYFLEHCSNPVSVVLKIYDLIIDGGVFAFSMPSFYGPMFLFKRKEWIKTHPVDHRVDFSPVTIKKLLKETGFNIIIIKPSGVHPERIISEKSIIFKPFSILYKAFSRLMKFSDTIEVYAVK